MRESRGDKDCNSKERDVVESQEEKRGWVADDAVEGAVGATKSAGASDRWKPAQVRLLLVN